MPSHFDAVGFEVVDETTYEDLVRAAVESTPAEATVERADGTTRHYLDPSGAMLVIHTDRGGEVVCSHPGFAGPARLQWRPLNVVRDAEGCPFCDLVYAEMVDDEGDPFYPFALTIENIETTRALIPYEERGEVTFAGLCEGGEVWADEQAHAATQEPDSEVPFLRGFAAQSLLPSGLFAEEGEPMSSHVFAHGIVTSTEERQNELRGGRFTFVRLDTLGGTFDVCLAPGTLEREELLAPGAVVGGTFWLIGRPVTLRSEPGPVPLAESEDVTGRPERRRGIGRFLRRLRG